MTIRRSAIALCAAVATSLTLAVPANALIVDDPVTDLAPDAGISLTPIGSHDTGQFDESAAEIVTYHAETQQLLVVNALSGNIDLLDITDPTSLALTGEVSAGPGNGINSVTVREDGLAVANVEPADKTAEGSMLFFDANTGGTLGSVMLGNNGEHDSALPDMVGISADGRFAFSANEGEPAEDYSADPEGSVSVVTLPALGTLKAPAQSDVRVADFRAWNETGSRELHDDIRIFGPSEVDGQPYSGSIAQNLEPEYITEIDGKAYTTLQENNAIAVIDLETAEVEDIWPLGFVDHNVVPLDASDRDGGEDTGAVEIRNWPVMGIPQPDAIESFTAGDGNSYLVMANEGDARDWEAYSEEVRIKHVGDPEEEDYKGDPLPALCEGYQDLTADEIDFLQDDLGAGRLRITIADGLNATGECFEQLYSYGSRDFAIFNTQGEKVFTSGAEFEQKLAELDEAGELVFNAGHDEAWFDSRSDNKGPEPEGVAVGEIDGRNYAFIGLERVGGVMVYDITDPANSEYVTYVNNRNFDVSAIDQDTEETNPNWQAAGDLGPEGLVFIPATQSPNNENLLAVGNEVSGTTTIFQIDTLSEEDPDLTPPAEDDRSGSSEGSAGFALGSSAGVIGSLAALLAALGGGVMTITNLLPQIQSLFTR